MIEEHIEDQSLSSALQAENLERQTAPKKILVLALGHIGDFIITLKAIEILHANFLAAEFTLVCLPSVISLAESTHLFARVIGFAAVPDSVDLGKVPQMSDVDQITQFGSLLDKSYFLAVNFMHDSRMQTWIDRVNATYKAGFVGQGASLLNISVPLMEWDTPTRGLPAGNLAPHAGIRLSILAHAIVEKLKAA